MAAIQVEYSLLQRTVEGELLGVARELGLGVTPWSPLASGVLTGKHTRENTSPEGSGQGRRAARHLREETFVVLDVLRRISDELGASMAAVAPAWVRQQPEVTSTITGPRTVEQLDFPADLLQNVAISYQQGGATINGIESSQFRR